ncbi:MAG: hypothetical protein GXC78_05855 [Chitinophagaceae bacterium]|nr:hypothetical protein [Chitinophagaceae bacterium]
MYTEKDIAFIQHRDIDRQAWDACVGLHSPDHIYAYSWYLDVMVPGWTALVLGNYKAVMPLPCRKKYGLQYLYQPFLTPQLGLITSDNSPALLRAFLDAIPVQYRYWDICLHHRNPPETEGYSLRSRINLVLPLQQPYEAIRQSYNENTLRNLRKAETTGLLVKKDIAPAEIMALSYQPLSPDQSSRLSRLYKMLEQRNASFTYGVTGADGQLLASAIFFVQQGRAFYILPGNSPDSRHTGASHMLIDQFIRQYAMQLRILDFEGSDIATVARFYRGFGAQQENYPALQLNRLPWFIRWLKN